MFPKPPVPRRRTSNRDLLTRLAIVLALSVLACDEQEKALTAPVAAEPQLAATSSPTQSAAGDVTAMGTIPLPIDQTFNGAMAFGITQTGTGRAGLFRINNTSNASNALDVSTNGSDPLRAALLATSFGLGRAGKFLITNTSSRSPAVEAITTGPGNAGFFQKNNSSTISSTALKVLASGWGHGLEVITAANGIAGLFQSTNPNTASAGVQSIVEGRGKAGSFISRTGLALEAYSRNGGVAGKFVSDGSAPSGAPYAVNIDMLYSTSTGHALRAATQGSGFAGVFKGTSNGVQITTNSGGMGLQVIGGSKNAVVGTTTGARALYSEEATEVWFADYGFGQLENGRVRILIDPGFAQTVSLDEPYHVFLQPYGRAEIYVEQRTELGFVVMLKDGDPQAEFGYRVVAKRRGFETQRLERAPWADNSPGF